MKPNHYYEDTLGDPATCTGDHNHPESLEARAAKAAANARCSACTALMLDSVEPGQIVFITLRQPATGATTTYQLCGSCALAVRRLLSPVVRL